MHTLDTARTAQEAFDLCLHEMLNLQPERAAVLYGYDADDLLIARSAQGLNKDEIFQPGQLSLKILQEVINAGQAKILYDASSEEGYGERMSTILSGIRSVMCCPVVDASGTSVGLLYADSRVQVSAFKNAQLSQVLDLAQRLQAKLTKLGRA